jgi:tetratricopeptide (TPR) repeat protein
MTNFDLMNHVSGSQIYGETRCHNQIAIRADSDSELHQILSFLSEILLVPFPITPTHGDFIKAVYKELEKVEEAKRTWGENKVLIIQDHTPTTTMSVVKDNCLVGPSTIHIEAWILNSNGMLMTTDDRLLPQALVKFKQALKLSPDYFDALYNAAACNAKLGNFKEAITYYKEALKLKPEDKDLIRELEMAKNEL